MESWIDLKLGQSYLGNIAKMVQSWFWDGHDLENLQITSDWALTCWEALGCYGDENC